MVISFSSVWKVLFTTSTNGCWTNTTDPANFLDSSLSPRQGFVGFVRVERMWWRALGVAVVLLCVGVAGGYAVADRQPEEPVAAATRSSRCRPMSPAVPTPPDRRPPARPRDRPARTRPAQLTESTCGSAAAASASRVDIPDGWRAEPVAGANMWNFGQAGQPVQHLPRCASTSSRGAERLDRRRQGRPDRGPGGRRRPTAGGRDFEVTAETDDTFEATYVDGGYLRVTMEKWVSLRREPRLRRRWRSPAAPSTRRGCATCWSGPSTRCGDRGRSESPTALGRGRPRSRGSRRRRGPGWRWRGRRCGPAPRAACWRRPGPPARR